MSSIVYLRNKTNGKTYAYLNESVWDKETGRCRCKRKCLGHLDPVPGEIIPNKGKKDSTLVTVKSVGTNHFLRRVSEKIGLTESLKAAFPGHWRLMLSSMFFILREPTEMSRIRYWSMENETPYRKQITKEDLIELFSEITDNSLFSFYREWRDHFDNDDFFTYHTSSVSSFDRRTETIRFNDLPDVTVKPETVLSVTYNLKEGLPITFDMYNRLPVSLTDIRKREHTNLWLEFNRVIEILDADYCTMQNLHDLLDTNQRFLIRASPQLDFAKQSVERVRDRIMDLSNYIMIDGEPFFVMSFIYYINGRKCFIHIYYSTADAEKEFSLFLSLIEQCEKELKAGVYVKEHEAFYNKYFRFFTNKGILQRNFDNIQNEKDRINLKLYSDTNLRGLLFLRFLAFILFTEVNNRLKSYQPTSKMHFAEVMNEMSAMKKVTIGDNAPVFTQVNQSQARILKAFGINVSELF